MPQPNRPTFLAVFVALLSLTSACGPVDVDVSGEDGALAETEAGLSTPALTTLSLRRASGSAGLVVLKSKAEFIAHFGQAPGADVDFRKHWVLHYQGERQPTLDASALITAVTVNGTGAARVMDVKVAVTQPGAGCGRPALPASETSPQHTVRIARQGSATARLTLVAQEGPACTDQLPTVRLCTGAPLTREAAFALFTAGQTVHPGSLVNGDDLVRECRQTGCAPWKSSSQAHGVAPWWYSGVTSELRYQGFSARATFRSRLHLAQGVPHLEIGDDAHAGVWESTFDAPVPATGPLTASVWVGGATRYPSQVQWEKGESPVIPWSVDLRATCFRLTAFRSVFSVDASGNPLRTDLLMELGGHL